MLLTFDWTAYFSLVYRQFRLKNVRSFSDFFEDGGFLCRIRQKRLFRFDFFNFNSVKFYWKLGGLFEQNNKRF